MPASVNLLPWREARVRQMCRLWVVLFSVPLLLLAGQLFNLRISNHQQQRLHTMLANGNAQLKEHLNVRERQMQTAIVQGEKHRQREQQRQITLGWQTTLQQLAEQLPPQAWLTAMHWQNGELRLSGVVRRFTALPVLEGALKGLSGFHSVTAGATHQDVQGYLQFSYQLAGALTDAE